MYTHTHNTHNTHNTHTHNTHTHTHTHQVAELAGFWLLSLLQTPLTLYTLSNTDTLPLPLEFALSIPLLLFLSTQLVLGLWTLYRLVGSQALKFHLAQSNRVLTHNSGSVGTEGGGEHIEMTKLS